MQIIRVGSTIVGGFEVIVNLLNLVKPGFIQSGQRRVAQDTFKLNWLGIYVGTLFLRASWINNEEMMCELFKIGSFFIAGSLFLFQNTQSKHSKLLTVLLLCLYLSLSDFHKDLLHILRKARINIM